jgi:hypothetical protein
MQPICTLLLLSYIVTISSAVPEAPEPLPEEKGKPLANFAFKF